MAARRFVVPKLELKVRRVAELTFRGTIAAGAWLTIVSGKITYPFSIVQAKMIFTDEANNWIEHRWYTSTNTNAPTTDFPADDNIFGRESPTTGFIGKAIIRVVNTSLEFPEGNLYIKLGTRNTGPYAYQVNGSIVIGEL